MLRSVNDLRRYKVAAVDGDLGSVEDVYFDDEVWVARYVIVDTGKWLPGRLVLVSPISVRDVDWVSRHLSVSLTREQVKNSPPIDSDRPVSRQKELEYFRYYGYPVYWGGSTVWGPAATPAALDVSLPRSSVPEVETELEANHLRSCREVIDYRLHATDGELGHVEDFLLDDETWALRYLIVDTRNWWFGRKVLVPPAWIETVSWSTRTVGVDVTREAVRSAPRFDAVEHVNRQWEADYYAHHKRLPYWGPADEPRRGNSPFDRGSARF